MVRKRRDRTGSRGAEEWRSGGDFFLLACCILVWLIIARGRARSR
jgi:hypothetical protein